MMRKLLAGALLALSLIAPSAAYAQVCPAVAALPDTERRVTYSPSASTGPFSITFPILGDSTDAGNWLEVWLNGTKLTFTTQWTFSLSGGGSVATACRPITTGQVTLITAATGTLEIVSARRPRRTSQFAENRGVSARDLNQVITDLTAMEREQWDLRSRTILAPAGESFSFLPSAASRANKFLVFDGAGNVALTSPTPGLGNVVGPLTSVVGNLATWNSTNGTALADSGASLISTPLVHPSSGNLVGAGCTTAHQLWFVDQNLCSTADVWQVTSTDPSAGFTAAFGGTRTTGDKITFNFTFGSGACIGGASPACDASYTAIAGDTLQHIANGIACAIANNSNLFNLNGGTCTAGVVTPAVGSTFGGYATGKQIGYVVATSNGIAFDFDSRVGMRVLTSVTGAATETITIANSNCGTTCSAPLDNNPVLVHARLVAGTTPQANSIISAWYAVSNKSTSLNALSVNYGAITHQVVNSTDGSLSSRWVFETTNAAGSAWGGTWFLGLGFYSSLATGGDKGADTVNALQYFLAGAPKYGTTISPAQLTTTTDNWNPTGLAGATEIRFSVNAAGVTITGITAQPAGTVLRLRNIGSFVAVISDQNVASTAANRFQFTTSGGVAHDIHIGTNEAIELFYDGTDTRWRVTAAPTNQITTGFAITGFITAAQITANQNDYNPTGLATSTILRLSSDASRNITGLSAPAANAFRTIINVGSFPIVLTNENAGSTAINRFSFGSDITLTAGQSVAIWHDTTASRWKLFSGKAILDVAGGGTGLTGLTSGGVLSANSATTMVSSGLLPLGSIVVGGGAGSAPSANLNLVATPATGTIQGSSTSSGLPSWQLTNTTADSLSGFIVAQKSRAGADVQSGDFIFGFLGQGFANAAFRNALQFNARVDGTPSGSNIPTRWEFTTSNAAALLNQTLTFNSAAHIAITQATAPAASACGTSPVVTTGSTDVAGEVTTGTGTPTGCVITFGTAHAAAPKCTVSWQVNLASMQYVVAAATITITQTATSSNKINWHCGGA